MHIGKFILFTSLGAAAWNTVLAILGYVAHGQKDLIDKYNHELKFLLWGLCFAFVAYLVVKGVRGARASKKEASSDKSETPAE
jgi:membrane protein DedA with SNARE-associated domain